MAKIAAHPAPRLPEAGRRIDRRPRRPRHGDGRRQSLRPLPLRRFRRRAARARRQRDVETPGRRARPLDLETFLAGKRRRRASSSRSPSRTSRWCLPLRQGRPPQAARRFGPVDRRGAAGGGSEGHRCARRLRRDGAAADARPRRREGAGRKAARRRRHRRRRQGRDRRLRAAHRSAGERLVPARRPAGASATPARRHRSKHGARSRHLHRQRHRAGRIHRIRHDARRCPPRQARPHRDQGRLPAGHLRRLHGRRSTASWRFPASSRRSASKAAASCTLEGIRRTARCIRCSGPSPRLRRPVRLLHVGHDHRRQGAARPATRTPTAPTSSRRSPATSAAAPATSRSSTPSCPPPPTAMRAAQKSA